MKCSKGHDMALETAHTGGYYDAEDYICPICGCRGRLWETGEWQHMEGERNGKENKGHSD